jgi:hypothetical protein
MTTRPRDDDDDDAEHDAIATSDDSASDTLHAQPKASRSNAAPTGKVHAVIDCDDEG